MTTVQGDNGDNTLNGGAGDDTILGEGGNDTIHGNDGNDHIFGGSGNDTIYGGAGDDRLTGGTGDDALYGGAGHDRFDSDAGADTLDGGADYDMVLYTTSPAAVHVDLSDDAPESGGHAEGDVLISIQAVYGSGFDDTLIAGTGTRFLDGGAGDDTIVGSSTTHRLYGRAGNDSITGGSGSESIYGGAGNDTITTGAGADIVVLETGDGTDTITDFDMTLTDGKTTDQIDVSDLVNGTGDPVTWQDVVVTDTVGDGTGDAILTFPGGERIVLQGVTPDQVNGKAEMQAMGIPCFVAGTLIDTPSGQRRVESLAAGDVVATESGQRRVIWAGARTLTADELTAEPGLCPVHFDPGAIGNTAVLRLSPQHAVVMEGAAGPVLVRSQHLATSRHPGVRVAKGVRAVTYHHVLLDRHAILTAAGARVESMYPGPQALAMLPVRARLDIALAIVSLARSSPGPVINLRDLSACYGPRVLPLVRRKDLRICLPAFSPPGFRSRPRMQTECQRSQG